MKFYLITLRMQYDDSLLTHSSFSQLTTLVMLAKCYHFCASMSITFSCTCVNVSSVDKVAFSIKLLSYCDNKNKENKNAFE